MQVIVKMTPPQSDEAVLKKRAKALRYAAQQDRYQVSAISAQMTSEHGTRDISYRDGKWSCTCEFFKVHGLCSHTLALEMIIKDQAHLRLVSPDYDCEE
jgi:SWIM zinc finger